MLHLDWAQKGCDMKQFVILSSCLLSFSIVCSNSLGAGNNSIAAQAILRKTTVSIDPQIIENQPIENFLTAYENGGVVQGKSGKKFLIIDIDTLKINENNRTWLYKILQNQGINLTPGTEQPPPYYPGVEHPPPYYPKDQIQSEGNELPPPYYPGNERPPPYYPSEK